MISFAKHYFSLLFLLISFLINAQSSHGGFKKSFTTSAKTQDQEKKQIKSLYTLYNNGEEKKAYKKAHQLLKKSEFIQTKNNLNLLIAYYFNKQSVLDSALFYTKKALENNTVLTDSMNCRLNCLGYNLMATIYNRKGLFSESKKYRIKGMDAAQKYNEQNLYFTHKHGLAVIYSKENDNTKALQLFLECSKYKEDPEMVYGSFINIGDIYSKLKNYDKANQYYQKADLLCQTNQNNYCSSIVSLSIGDNFLEQNQNQKALEFYQKALKFASPQNYQQLELSASISIAKIYVSQKKYNEAKTMFNNGLKNATDIGLLQEQIIIYEELKKIALEQQDYKEAYNFSNQTSTLKDSIAVLQNKKEINELEIKFNTLQKEKAIRALQFDNETSHLKLLNQAEAITNLNLQKEIARKQSENTLLSYENATQKKISEIALLKKQKQLTALEINQEKNKQNSIIISFSLLILLILGLLFQYYKRLKTQRLLNKKQTEISKEKLSSVLKEQELKLIKASVAGQDKERKRMAQELHDSIGGNLAAIKIQLLALDLSQNTHLKHTILPLLDETYDEVRNLSHNLIPKKFSQNPFCLVLEDYLNSICEASELKLDLQFHPKKEINELDEKLQSEIFKIIQELLTNTIKHSGATKIVIRINLIEKHLNISFEDNGNGFNTKNYKKGIGLINLENRVKQFQGNFEITSNPKHGTHFNFEIPTN